MLTDDLPEETYPVIDTQDSKASFLLPATYSVEGRLGQLCRNQYGIQGSLLWQVPPIRNLFLTVSQFADILKLR